MFGVRRPFKGHAPFALNCSLGQGSEIKIGLKGVNNVNVLVRIVSCKKRGP